MERLEEIGLSIAFASRGEPSGGDAAPQAPGGWLPALSRRFRSLLQSLRVA